MNCVCFNHSLEEVMETQLLKGRESLLLPLLNSTICSTFIFTHLLPNPPPKPALSELKKERKPGHAILHRTGGALVVLSQGPHPNMYYAISRQTTNDLGKQCVTGPVPQQLTLSLSGVPAGEVALG